MAIFTATDARIYLAQFSLTAHTRNVELSHKAAALDKTTFGYTTKTHLAGLKEIGLTFAGYQDYAALGPDAALSSKFVVADAPVTVSPDGGDEGETAYFFKAMVGDYLPMSATIGELAPFSGSAVGSTGPLVRGVIGATGSKTTTTAGAVQTLGAVTAAQSIYAAFHVLSVTGTNPTLDVIVQSDADGTFPAGSTTRVTFVQATAAGSQFLSAAGAITDTYWRVAWTIGGTDTPTFDIVVAIGIV